VQFAPICGLFFRVDDEIVLINCAVGSYNAVAHKADVEKWKHLIDVNLVGTFSMINAVLPTDA
jgi:NADP-dependent 3-hydroxy acid dehydrogenase YdfG